MSDVRFYDVACCWVESNEAHATFHHTVVRGNNSLSLWRFLNCKAGETFLTESACRMNWLNGFLDDHDDWQCGWCKQDQHVCECEVDSNGLVWTEHGVGIPFEDWDFPF